ALNTEPDPNLIHTPKQRRGDGVINMRDLRAFRDALAQVQRDGGAITDVALDADSLRPSPFKLDLNQDGCVNNMPAIPSNPLDIGIVDFMKCAVAPGENVHPRFDFNGSGRIDLGQITVTPLASAWAPVGWDPDLDCSMGQWDSETLNCKTDLMMLEDPGLWQTDEENVTLFSTDFGCASPPPQWTATAVTAGDRDSDGFDDYLMSADLHFNVTQADSVIVLGDHMSGAWNFVKCRSGTIGDSVVTVPISVF